jgi:lysophospholipase
LRNSRKGYVRSFDEYAIDLDTFINEVVLPDCPPPHFALAHSMGATILLRAAYHGNRTFDRTVLLAPMIALPGLRRTRSTRVVVRAMRLAGLGMSFVPGGDSTVMMRALHRQSLTSIRSAMRAMLRSRGEARTGDRVADRGVGGCAFRAMSEFASPGYALKVRQPMLIVAAGQDQIVSTPAIDEFSVRLRAGSHLIVPGARHELLMEQDRFRGQALAAFDAFVPGTPLF